MSFRVRDIHSIHSNPLNKSVSKQLYSIPKANRFQRCQTVLSDKYYDIPSTNNLKAASFAQANRKSIFSVTNQMPSPGQYTLSQIKLEVRNIIFHQGRQSGKLAGFLEDRAKTPGPAAYNPNPEILLKTSGKFSFKAKKNVQEQKKMNQTPGPGAYPQKLALLDKDKILSTQKKMGCVLMKDSNFKRALEFNREILDAPYYFPKQHRTGKETFNETGGFSIGKSLRFKDRVKTEPKWPGPGAYNQFSEFI